MTVKEMTTSEQWDMFVSEFSSRDEIAKQYAEFLLLPSYDRDNVCKSFNAAILRRYSISSLKYIKEKAWKLNQSSPFEEPSYETVEKGFDFIDRRVHGEDN